MRGNTYSYKLYDDKKFKKALTKEEQNKYLKLASQGNYEAKKLVFEHNLRLVAYIIDKNYRNIDYDKEELFQSGCLGLWNSIQRFNVSLGTQFSTYAVPIINGEIKKLLRENNILKIPYSVQRLLYQIVKITKEYEKKNIELTQKKLAQLLNVTEKEIEEAINSSKNLLSLEKAKYINKLGKEEKLENFIEIPNYTIEEEIEKIELNEIILKTINLLNYREKLIIKQSFGIGCKRKSQKEIAKMLNISQAHVSRIYTKTLKNLKYILPKYLSDEPIIDNQNKESDTKSGIKLEKTKKYKI